MTRAFVMVLSALLMTMGSGCGGGSSEALRSGEPIRVKRAQLEPRERGCTVQVFDRAPPHSENIGPVSALCAEEDSRDACLRELQDQVCLVGGDALWQVEGPMPENTQNGVRQRMRGRAVHSKS